MMRMPMLYPLCARAPDGARQRAVRSRSRRRGVRARAECTLARARVHLVQLLVHLLRVLQVADELPDHGAVREREQLRVLRACSRPHVRRAGDAHERAV